MWPTIDFGAVTATEVAASLRAWWSARVSVASLALVEVPWAQTRSTPSGRVPARSSASPMAWAA